MKPRFLQIHTLTSYPAALLNRDEVGAAKSVPFGGFPRTRVSSQCLKRSWRTAQGEWSIAALGVPLAVRSRRIFSERIGGDLVREGVSPAVAAAVLRPLMGQILQGGDKASAGEDDEPPVKAKRGASAAQTAADDPLKSLETGQVIVLGEPEIAFITAAALSIIRSPEGLDDPTKAAAAYVKGHRENVTALARASGIDGALFGRMVTSDLFARSDAAIHVAHSLTVHSAETEPEYFTAVDDLVEQAGKGGSGLIGQSELTSGTFYGYVVVDVPLLVSNLSGDSVLAATIVENLIRIIVSQTPGAKLGSTAPYAYAGTVLIEAGERQPRTLANAFLKPVRAQGDMGAAAATALAQYLSRFETMYGAHENRFLASLEDLDIAGAEKGSMGELAAWSAACVADFAAAV